MAGRPRTQPVDLAACTRKYVTPLQLALYLEVSRSTIYNQIDKGTIRIKKIGGLIRIPLAAAREYADLDTAAYR